MPISRERVRLEVPHADQTTLAKLADEIDAFWTKGADVERIEVELTADEGFVAAFREECELDGVLVEEKAPYEE